MKEINKSKRNLVLAEFLRIINSFFGCLSGYMTYLEAVKCIDVPQYKIIFKFDDLVNCNKKVLKLDKLVKYYDLKVCWGIIGNSLENVNRDYIEFIKNNSGGNYYHFFNHGYYHLQGPEYEFFNKPEEEQEVLIRKTQDIVRDNTGVVLDSFGAPCNHVDDNTRIALESITEIKYWFYGKENYNSFNIKRLIDMEISVGKPNFKFFINRLRSLKDDTGVLTLQGHPYMWGLEQWFNFKLIVLFLKRVGCKFIFPNEVGEIND